MPSASALHRSIKSQIPQVEHAVTSELNLEGKRQHRRAVRLASQAEAKLKRSVEMLLAKPTHTIDDLIVLAEVARHLRADVVEPWRCLDDRVLAAIAKGVLAVGDLSRH